MLSIYEITVYESRVVPTIVPERVAAATRNALRTAANSARDRDTERSGFFLNPTLPQVADASAIAGLSWIGPRNDTRDAGSHVSQQAPALRRNVTVHQTVAFVQRQPTTE